MSSLDRILPFLSPIAHLLNDVEVTEVMVNCGGRKVFAERRGAVQLEEGCTIPEALLQTACKHIARSRGDEIGEATPILDARLEDGSRISAMFPPCSVDGTTLTIRRFGRRYTLANLVRSGSVTAALAERMMHAVDTRQTMLISGGTGTGKTTVLNALAAFIPDSDRVALLEDTSEISLAAPNLVRFETRTDNAGLPAVTMADLLRAVLRHRPDRIILGEVRGPEAFDLLQALNTGHRGSLTTIHANSAAQALTRLAHCVLSAGMGLPHESVREAIGDAVNAVVHIERRNGRRTVAEFITVDGYHRGTGDWRLSRPASLIAAGELS